MLPVALFVKKQGSKMLKLFLFKRAKGEMKSDTNKTIQTRNKDKKRESFTLNRTKKAK